MFAHPDTRRAALSSLLSLCRFYISAPLLGMQPKQITRAILRCVFSCGLRPNFYRNITAAAAEAGLAAPKLDASFPAKPSASQNCGVAKPLTFPGK